MNAPGMKKAPFLLILAAVTLFAAFSDAGAVAPWFRPGGLKPVPMGKAQAPRRSLYREERFIRHLYKGFLDRNPAPDEVRTWTRKMEGENGAAELVQSFMDSDEFFVRQAFLGLLGREPDPSGMNTFHRALQNGQSRAEVLESIIWSPEFQEKLH